MAKHVQSRLTFAGPVRSNDHLASKALRNLTITLATLVVIAAACLM